MKQFIKAFKNIHLADLPEVGGKNASLGEMYTTLSTKGIVVPDGFAITASAFKYYLSSNNLKEKIEKQLESLDRKTYANLSVIGNSLRNLMLAGKIPDNLAIEIQSAYSALTGKNGESVAVRSSATAEDLPTASFAGLHESFLNVKNDDLLDKVRQCFASLYTDRAIKYREDKGFDHGKVFLSVGIQKMVRSDLACSGIGFTLDPESGFKDVVHLSGVWGLGENIVQGTVIPDEFVVFKPTFLLGKQAIIRKSLGEKATMMMYGSESSGTGTVNVSISQDKRDHFVLTDDEVSQLAGWGIELEEHYGRPIDFEWAKDGVTKELFIIQARPETVHSSNTSSLFKSYTIKSKGKKLLQGQAIGTNVAIGKARVLHSVADSAKLQEGEIIIAEFTTPDWDPLMKKAAGLVTNQGGRTSHAAIIARELGLPAIVGTVTATGVIKDGETISLSCCEGATGFIYEGALDYQEQTIDLNNIHLPESTDAMMIIADPGKAFLLAQLPNHGVGLLRLEFIITNAVKAHPMALAHFSELKDESARKKITELTKLYPGKEEFFVEKLAEGVGTIAAAFYPKDVIVRMSDFKTNEYASLLGGKEFEPAEENPMIGFRGASRYYNSLYKDGFRLECMAINKLRGKMGFTNLKIMIPFCRTIKEAKQVIGVMEEYGLDRKKDPTLEIYAMVEVPSNVILADKFADIFDGFSIGSNDLTQLTLGIDRDSVLLSQEFNEQDEAVEKLIAIAIQKSKSKGIKIGLCGQAASDIPEFAAFLVNQGINSISFNPDALLKGIENIRKAEQNLSGAEKSVKKIQPDFSLPID